jgi:hypothetical protein
LNTTAEQEKVMEDTLQIPKHPNEFYWPVRDGADMLANVLTRADARKRKQKARWIIADFDAEDINEIISRLIELLGHDDAAARLIAADSLIAFGRRVLPALQAKLDTTTDSAVQVAVAELLGKIGGVASDGRTKASSSRTRRCKRKKA